MMLGMMVMTAVMMVIQVLPLLLLLSLIVWFLLLSSLLRVLFGRLPPLVRSLLILIVSIVLTIDITTML